MKTEIILTLYDSFLRGEKILRRAFCERFALSERTFYRYMRVISSFVRSHKPGYIIDIEEGEGAYYLKNL